MAVETDPRIGTSIAGYQIERLFGQGGMSAVYLAYDPGLDRRVALKLMSPGLSDDPGFRDRFRVEWRRTASIEHPNVVPVYDAAEADGQLYIATRYIEGTDLKALLETEGALEPERALNLLSQTAAGLDAAHDRGLVHRDVKPSNVLVSFDRDGEHAYLADFGLTKPASTAEEARESIQLSGTTDYVSPEQIADGTADARSDIYGLGALLYECLTGHVPYPRDRSIKVLWAHLNDPPPRPTEIRPELPEAIDRVIATAMAKEPEDRYGTGAELADAVVAAFPEPRRPWWQIRALSALVALLVAAAVAIPAILLTGGSGEGEPLGTTEITTNSIQRIDPETRRLVGTIELESAPDDVAAGESGVWLMRRSDQTLIRVDPETNTVEEPIPLHVLEGGAFPRQIDLTEDAVLTSFSVPAPFVGGSGSVWSYDLAEGTFTEVFSSDINDYFPGDFAVGFGDVLVLDSHYPEHNASALVGLRVDDTNASATIPLVTDAFQARSQTGGGVPVGIDDESAWILTSVTFPDLSVSPDTRLLWKIDRETNEFVVTEVPGSVFPVSFAIGQRFVWVPTPTRDFVLRVDRATNELAGELRVGRQPVAAVWAEGAVWIANSRDGTVSRIDPESFDVETIDIGATPTNMAATEDGVWVTVRP